MDKEDYTLRVHVRHASHTLLEKLSDLTLSVTFKLPTSVSLDVYTSHAQASTLGKTANGGFTLAKNCSATLYVVCNANVEKHLKALTTQGCYLTGTICLGNKVSGSEFAHSDDFAVKI